MTSDTAPALVPALAPPDAVAAALPKILLLCVHERYKSAFEHARDVYALPAGVQIEYHECSLSLLPAEVKFDLIVSPANSYGLLDGGFDDAISRAFSPRDDYLALTHAAQDVLYRQWRGFAPPGTTTLVPIPPEYVPRSKNVWSTKHLALCPTMREPDDVRWDREVVYECTWTLMCEIDKFNAARRAERRSDESIASLLMTPFATGCGQVSADKWASQTVLAIRHFVESMANPEAWSRPDWGSISHTHNELEETWNL